MNNFFEKLPEVWAKDQAFAVRQLMSIANFPLLLSSLFALLLDRTWLSIWLVVAALAAAAQAGLSFLDPSFFPATIFLSIGGAFLIVRIAKGKSTLTRMLLKAVAVFAMGWAIFWSFGLASCGIDNIEHYGQGFGM